MYTLYVGNNTTTNMYRVVGQTDTRPVRVSKTKRVQKKDEKDAARDRIGTSRSIHRDMLSLSATSSQVRVTPRATTRRASSSRGAALVVRAEEKAAADAAPAVWTAPKLNPNTPSPIFGGSTGGLLRKAQVRVRAMRKSQRFSFGRITRRDFERMSGDATVGSRWRGVETNGGISYDLETGFCRAFVASFKRAGRSFRNQPSLRVRPHRLALERVARALVG